MLTNIDITVNLFYVLILHKYFLAKVGCKSRMKSASSRQLLDEGSEPTIVLLLRYPTSIVPYTYYPYVLESLQLL